MNPTANLNEQVKLATRLPEGMENPRYNDIAKYERDVDRLCELVLALNEWMRGGGHLPNQWQREEKP